jgi:hypothetical protein
MDVHKGQHSRTVARIDPELKNLDRRRAAFGALLPDLVEAASIGERSA